MKPMDRTSQSIILKGVASQILQMTHPTIKEFNALLKEFNLELVDLLEPYDPKTKTEKIQIDYSVDDDSAPIAKVQQVKEPTFKSKYVSVCSFEGESYGFPMKVERSLAESSALKQFLVLNGYPENLIKDLKDGLFERNLWIEDIPDEEIEKI